MNDQLHDTVSVAKRLGVSKSFLDKARLTGDGPAFVKLGKAVRYNLADVEAWIASRRRTSTSVVA